MEGVHDNASAFIGNENKLLIAKVTLLFNPSWVICQKAKFLDSMVMHIRKPENEDISFKE